MTQFATTIPDDSSVSLTRKPLSIKRALLIAPFNQESSYSLEVVSEGRLNVEIPLGLAYIKAYGKKHLDDIEIKILDAHAMAIKHIQATGRVDYDELFGLLGKEIVEFKPDIVGVSCIFFTLFRVAHRICQTAKSILPMTVTVMGGNYPSSMPKIALEDKNLDFILYSEGEVSFTQLISSLRTGVDPADVIDGIAYNGKETLERIGANALDPVDVEVESEYITIPKNEFTPTLEEYPWPDRSDLDMEFYATKGRHFVNRVEEHANVRLATITGSRGCPFSCTFCASQLFWGKQIRYRDPKVVVAEMKSLVDTYGINTFAFNDDNLIFNAKEVLSFANELIRQNLKIRWFATGGIQVSGLKRPDVVQAVIESGLRQFNLAIETGDAKTAHRIKKPLKPEITDLVISNLRKYEEAWLYGFFITGFYFETMEDIERNLEYAGSLDLDWRGFYSFTPIPGTADYETCVEKGLIEDFATLSHHFSGDMIMLTTKEFTAQQLLTKNYRANLKYNFIGNRNLTSNPTQAIREFNYILDSYPEHAYAYFARSLAQKKLGLHDEANASLKLCHKYTINSEKLESHSFQSNIQITDAKVRWGDYFRDDGIDIEAEIKRSQSVE